MCKVLEKKKEEMVRELYSPWDELWMNAVIVCALWYAHYKVYCYVYERGSKPTVEISAINFA